MGEFFTPTMPDWQAPSFDDSSRASFGAFFGSASFTPIESALHHHGHVENLHPVSVREESRLHQRFQALWDKRATERDLEDRSRYSRNTAASVLDCRRSYSATATPACLDPELSSLRRRIVDQRQQQSNDQAAPFRPFTVAHREAQQRQLLKDCVLEDQEREQRRLYDRAREEQAARRRSGVGF